jgi:hypothetical protein
MLLFYTYVLAFYVCCLGRGVRGWVLGKTSTLNAGEDGQGKRLSKQGQQKIVDGFRFNWTGWPQEAPAVVVEASQRGGRRRFVSVGMGIGDDGLAVWRFYGGGRGGKRKGGSEKEGIAGETERTGFESCLESRMEEGGASSWRKPSVVVLTKSAIVEAQPRVLRHDFSDDEGYAVDRDPVNVVLRQYIEKP